MRKNASEKMRDCLLFTKIEKDYSFERQHDYIISWIDKNLEEEIAISFIDPIAANETWYFSDFFLNVLGHNIGRKFLQLPKSNWRLQ